MKTAKSETVVKIPAGGTIIEGNLAMPPRAKELVVFAHGSGSGRKSPRNQYVARALNGAGMATLLVDLLTKEEEEADEGTGRFRFDIGLLARRLMAATEWVLKHPKTERLAIGYFGASTGAAAALIAASNYPGKVAAIVSRGGRPDLAMEHLEKVKAPTLFIVGNNDEVVLDLNKRAMGKLSAENVLKIVPDATHLFEEPGKLEEVANLSAKWFLAHLR